MQTLVFRSYAIILFIIDSSYPEHDIVYVFRIYFKILTFFYFNHIAKFMREISEMFVEHHF